jgi:hypothetical protein
LHDTKHEEVLADKESLNGIWVFAPIILYSDVDWLPSPHVIEVIFPKVEPPVTDKLLAIVIPLVIVNVLAVFKFPPERLDAYKVLEPN